LILFIGHRSSVIGHRSSVIGHRSSVIGHRSSVIERGSLRSVDGVSLAIKSSDGLNNREERH
jgi:hypothetical protein